MKYQTEVLLLLSIKNTRMPMEMIGLLNNE